MERRFIAAFILITLLTFFMRALPLLKSKFIDSETMAAVLIMKQTIDNNYTIGPDPLSSFPTHPYVFAEQGIIYLAVLPYRMLHFLGLFGTMYLIKALFLILGVVTVYFFSKRISSSTYAGLLGMLFYAVSQVGIFTEAFNRWKGDVFVPVLLVFSVLVLLHLIETPREQKGLRLLMLAMLLLSLLFSTLLWNGGLYADAAFGFAVLALFLEGHTRYFRNSALILAAIIAAGWMLIAFTQLHNTIGLGPLTMPQLNYTASQLVQMLGQVEPLAYQTALLYNTVYYPFWIFVGFLGSFAILFITILRFQFPTHGRSERRAYVAALSLLLFGIPLAILLSRFNSLIFMEIAILSGSSFGLLGSATSRKLLLGLLLVVVPLTVLFAAYQILTTPEYAGISSQFHSQLLWVKQNTPHNATFLSLDGDGTAIQYWANRTTYTDTNLADNVTRIEAFYTFLNARAGNFTYLQRIKPDYLLLHQLPKIQEFEGSNLQYLIEWAFNPNPEFSYNGVHFTLVYANFSLAKQADRILLYELSYINAT